MPSRRHWLLIANWGLVLGLLLSLWVPLWLRHRVDALALTAADVEASRSRPQPALREAATALAFDERVWPMGGKADRQRANEVLRGQVRLAGRPVVTMAGLTWWDDPFQDPSWRLAFQGLAHARVLVAAWHATRRPEYLAKAKDIVLSWIEADRRWPFGGGFMWNDHAAAERAVTLSTFWGAYADSASYDPAVGALVVGSLTRHVGFLMDPRHFTFQTNHGVMQSLALLHVAAMMPVISERLPVVDTAVRRISSQYRLLVTPEGVWTEHSPGYQLMSVNLLRAAARYLELLGHPVPAEWTGTLSRLERTIVEFARPDGSLPAIGDTVEITRPGDAWPRDPEQRWPGDLLRAVQARDRSEQFVAPCAGYAVLWDDSRVTPTIADRSQLVMTVSNFPGHAHKHADELALYLFARGRTWLTGPGDWPYASPQRGYATGWTGANAPAYDDESEVADRRAELTGVVHAPWGDLIAMQRTGPMGLHVERQVVWIRPDSIIVADRVTASGGKPVVVRWLFASDSLVESTGERHWRIRAQERHDRSEVGLWVLSDGPASVTVTRGGHHPFHGWVYDGNEAKAAPVFEIRPERAQALVVTILGIASRPRQGAVTEPRLTTSAHDWSVALAGHSGARYRLDASKTHVTLNAVDGRRETNHPIEPIRCSAETQGAYADIRHTLESEYGGFPDRGSVPLSRYRDVTVLAIATLVVQEISLMAIKRHAPRLAGLVRIASCLVVISVTLLLFVRWGGTHVV